MKMTLEREIEGALQRLHVTYRRLDMKDCTMYFCQGPQGVNFTLSLSNDNILQIWRFLPVITPENSEFTKLERQFEDHLAGLEVTEDQLFNFYVCQDLEEVPEEERQELVFRRIVGFLLTGSRLEESFLDLGLEPADFGHPYDNNGG